jgi:DnaB-like helicase N terminal domain
MLNATLDENRLLGGFLVGLVRYPALVEAALKGLEPCHFAEPSNQVVFGAVCALRATGTTVDLVTVAEHLNRQDSLWVAGGYVRLAELWTSACEVNEVPKLAESLARKDQHTPDTSTSPSQPTQLQLPDDFSDKAIENFDTSFNFGANAGEGRSE